MSTAISFLVIDDEESIVLTLQTLIQRIFPDAIIYTALNGTDGWELLQKYEPSIVISDLSMPGLTGTELCKKTKASEKLLNTYFIILTAYSSKEQRISALENGADDFLAKPIGADELLARLRSASRIVNLQYQLQDENRKLKSLNDQLKQDLEDMISLAIAFLNSRIPETKEMIESIKKISVWIGRKFGEFNEQEIDHIRMAASLCLIGKLYLPDHLIHQLITIDGKATHELMHQVPLSAQTIINPAARFQKIGITLRHIFENYDGSGFPDRLQTREIPLASRIIRVALDFVSYRVTYKLSVIETLDRVKREAKRLYDPRFVYLLDEYVWAMSPEILNAHASAVQLYELLPGMEIVRDIITNSGLKLVPAGTILQEKTIERLVSYTSSDPILGAIYIRKI